MPPIDPTQVVFPKNRIKRVVRVLHDGTRNDPKEFSIAQVELNNGETRFGIRHNLNDWNENNPDLGYPTCRPGNPTWFILPNPIDLLEVMNRIPWDE